MGRIIQMMPKAGWYAVADSDDHAPILTQGETEAVCLAALDGSGRLLTEAEMARVVDWAIQARIAETMLSLVLNGYVLINAIGAELVFRHVNRNADGTEIMP